MPMTLTIHLLGRPHLERSSGSAYEFRSRKTWALLAYLVLCQRQPSRAEVASLLFSTADDPLRALRWSLSEIRRGLGDDGMVDGDPLALQLSATTTVDVAVVAHGTWAEAVAIPGLGAGLLEGMDIRARTASPRGCSPSNTTWPRRLRRCSMRRRSVRRWEVR